MAPNAPEAPENTSVSEEMDVDWIFTSPRTETDPQGSRRRERPRKAWRRTVKEELQQRKQSSTESDGGPSSPVLKNEKSLINIGITHRKHNLSDFENGCQPVRCEFQEITNKIQKWLSELRKINHNNSPSRVSNMNPAVIKIGVGVVCTAVVILVTLWKSYKDSQRCQPAMEEISSFNEDNVSICCICLNEFEDFPNKSDLCSLPCKHRFHRSCITTLFFRENGHRSCPLCRRSVSDEYLTKCL